MCVRACVRVYVQRTRDPPKTSETRAAVPSKTPDRDVEVPIDTRGPPPEDPYGTSSLTGSGYDNCVLGWCKCKWFR